MHLAVSKPSDRDEVHQVDKIAWGGGDSINVMFLIANTI